MNMKTLALTAALAVAAATAANAASNELKNGQFNNGLNKWETFGGTTLGTYKNSNAAYLTSNGRLAQFFEVAVSGAYDFGFKFDALKNLTFKLTDLDNNVTLLSNNIIAGLAGKFNTTLNLNSGFYALSFASNKAYVDNVSIKSTVAVPGPEAGAGLGALAMGGVAFLVARRRRETMAA